MSNLSEGASTTPPLRPVGFTEGEEAAPPAPSPPPPGAPSPATHPPQGAAPPEHLGKPSGGYADDPDALRNLIVNYLPPHMDEAQLLQLFGQFGPIDSVKIIYDKETGESRGYGFVKFQFFFSATYAISCLNRFNIAGKKLKIAYANAAAAREAYDMLKLSAAAFSAQQQNVLESMYYNQVMMQEQQQQQQQRGGDGGRGAGYYNNGYQAY